MIVDRIYRLPGDDVVEQVDRRAPIVDGLDDGAAGDGVDSQQAHRQDRAGDDEGRGRFGGACPQDRTRWVVLTASAAVRELALAHAIITLSQRATT